MVMVDMANKTNNMFENFKTKGVQTIYITFTQFKELLDTAHKNGIDVFYYSHTIRHVSLESDEGCKKYFNEIEFTYDEGIKCMNIPPPEVFSGIKFQFFPEKSVVPVKVKKETKQVTF